MMDIVERYLTAIRRNLPADKANDVTAELREDLLSRAEERQAALGRALTQSEMDELVRDSGHPLLVASRYWDWQWLIGPVAFPFYLSVLRIVLLVVAAVSIVGGAAGLLLGSRSSGQALAETVANLFLWSLVAGAVVTLVFALLERMHFPADGSPGWSPQQLPEIGQEHPGPWKSAIEVALTIALLLWWVGLLRLPVAPGGPGFRLEAAPIWTELYWPILILIAARLVHNLIQWLRPRWRMVLAALDAATAVGALVLLAFVFQAGEWITVVPAGIPEAETRDLQASLDLALRIGIFAIGVIWLLASLGGLWNLYRSLRESAA